MCTPSGWGPLPEASVAEQDRAYITAQETSEMVAQRVLNLSTGGALDGGGKRRSHVSLEQRYARPRVHVCCSARSASLGGANQFAVDFRCNFPMYYSHSEIMIHSEIDSLRLSTYPFAVTAAEI